MEYAAILIVSFGSPEKMEDVKPYLDNVLKGIGVIDAIDFLMLELCY